MCSLFAFQWPMVSVRMMARVSLTSRPLISRKRKAKRPCGIRAGWRMAQMQTGCWITHTQTHAHIHKLWYQSLQTRHTSALLLTSSLTACRLVVCFLPLTDPISSLKCQENTPGCNCYSLHYYLSSTCRMPNNTLNNASHHAPLQSSIL